MLCWLNRLKRDMPLVTHIQQQLWPADPEGTGLVQEGANLLDVLVCQLTEHEIRDAPQPQ